jgi:hypothetical protein
METSDKPDAITILRSILACAPKVPLHTSWAGHEKWFRDYAEWKMRAMAALRESL